MIVVIACGTGILLYCLTGDKSPPVPEKTNTRAASWQDIEKGVIEGYSRQLRAGLSIQMPRDFDAQVDALLRGPSKPIAFKDGTFASLRSGKDLWIDVTGEVVIDRSYRSLLGVTPSQADLNALVNKLKEATLTAARDDARRIKQCGKSALEGQPANCLVKQLSERRDPVEAINALVKREDPWTEEVVPSLGKALGKDEKAEVRRAAAEALGKIDPGTVDAQKAIGFLVGALKQKDEDSEVRRLAVQALAAIGHASGNVWEILTEVQKNDQDEKVRRSAEEALKRIQKQ